MLIIAYAVSLAILWITFDILIRKLADIGSFLMRVLEMTGLAITRDRIFFKVYIACNERVWEEIKKCCDPNDIGTKIIRVNKGLHYIGRPWVYQVYEWYMTLTDKEDTKVKPLHSLPLSVLTIEYGPEDKDPTNGTPNLKTADGVDVRAKLIVYIIIRNPWKALFNVEHIKTFLRGQIMAKWRETLAGFQFFEYSTKEDKIEKEIYLRTQMEHVNEGLRERIGISKEKDARFIFQDPKDLTGVRKFIFDEGGIIIEDITIAEFEAADPAIEKALEQLLIGKADAQRIIQDAKGKMESKKLIAQGDKNYIEEVAKAIEANGESAIFLQTLDTIKSATENISKAQNLTIFGLNEILGPLGEILRNFERK